VLREFQFNLTVDTASGRSTAYLLECTEFSQWQWLADTEFGPFETSLDICTWMTMRLRETRALSMR
jgi:hypothetical protein